MNLKEAFNNNFNIERTFKVIKNQEGCSVSLSKDDLAINSPNDSVRVSDVDGNEYIFKVCDSVTCRPSNTKNKALPLDNVFIATLTPDGIHWRNCAVWMDKKSNQVKIEGLIDSRTVSTNKGIFQCANFLDDVDSLDTTGDILGQVRDGKLVDYCIMF